MTAERWREIERIYNEALDRSPDERGAFISAACGGDADLQHEIEALLAARSKDSLLDGGGAAAAAQVFAQLEQGDIAGRQLGPYQVIHRLGEGGMGVVYKALDTRLKRFVAIKILRPETLADADRRRRFVQEAQAASALNHPNIVTVHDIGTQDGVDYIAMEYVAGKTLDAMIPRKGMRIKDVLHIAIEIAAGLERAHSAGIVHRDVKPGNVIVGEDGQVKILDFGLAKLTERGGNADSVRDTYTLEPHTKEGTVLGTAAYMSPEQAEGRRVDARSDIFSFGSVLYEMVTGERAFRGDSNLSTLAAMLKDQRKPVSSLVPQTPRDLERLVNRCLRKEPERRFQHVGDLRLALLELKEESESGQPEQGQSEAAPRKLVDSALGWSAAALVLLGAGSAGLFIWQRSRAAPPPKPSLLTSYQGFQHGPALSPDGRQVAFSWNGESSGSFSIYLKLVDAGSPLQLTNEPGAEDASPAWSPDARYIAFCRTSARGSEILSIPALGGAARKLAPVETCKSQSGFPDGISWSPDGTYLAVSDLAPDGKRSIFAVLIESGEKLRLTWPPGGFTDLRPRLSPDGKHLVFIRLLPPFRTELHLLPLSSNGTAHGQPTMLTRFAPGQILDVDWMPDSRRIVFTRGTSYITGALMTMPAAGGEVAPFAGGGDNNVLSLSISRSGHRIVYERSSSDWNIWRIPGPQSPEHRGPATRLIASTQIDYEPQYAPDGTKIAFTSTRSGHWELWAADAEGTHALQLTSFGGPLTGSPRWSPDNRSIAFDSAAGGNAGVYIVSADGGRPRRFTTGQSDDVRPSWSRDGRWIYFGSNRSGAWQIWKAPAAGGAALQVTRGGGREAFESVDGNYLYWAKSDVAGIWRMPARGGEETRALNESGESLFAIAEPGLWFFDLSGPGSPKLNVLHQATLKVAPFREFPNGTAIDTSSTALSISPDRRWILYTQYDQFGSNLMLVDGFR